MINWRYITDFQLYLQAIKTEAALPWNLLLACGLSFLPISYSTIVSDAAANENTVASATTYLQENF